MMGFVSSLKFKGNRCLKLSVLAMGLGMFALGIGPRGNAAHAEGKIASAGATVQPARSTISTASPISTATQPAAKGHSVTGKAITRGGVSCTLIDFEGIGNAVPIGTIAGTPNVTFGDSWLAAIDFDAGGSGNFANEPSPDTTAYHLAPVEPIDFDAGVQFVEVYYSAAAQSIPLTLTAWDGPGGTGNVVDTVVGNTVGNNLDGAPCIGDPNGDFCLWDVLQLTSAQNNILSVTFAGGVADLYGLDDMAFCLGVPDTGACCDHGTGKCHDGVLSWDCTGAQEEWFRGAPCDQITCDYVPTYGACCDDVTGVCNNGVETLNCQHPLRFTADTPCADLDPPCGEGGCQGKAMTIEILTDNFPLETTWEVTHKETGAVVASGGPYGGANTLYTHDICLEASPNCYNFTIFDALDDGICCGYGEGHYTVYYQGQEVCTGGDFASSETCGNIGEDCGAGIFGACCDDSTEFCGDDVEALNCHPPLRFTADTLCADLDPRCGEGGCQGKDMTIEILTDNWPGETTWEVRHKETNVVVASGGPYEGPNTLYSHEACLELSPNCYNFTIFDAYDDGICCAYGEGHYTVYYQGGVVCTGGEFDSSETCEGIGEDCGPGCIKDFVVTAPGIWTGDTCGAGNDCPLGTSEEHVYSVTLPNAGDWTFSLCGSQYDTYVHLGTACCSEDIGSNDDFCDLQSKITANLAAGTYWVAVEGFSSDDCGAYTLTVSKDASFGACCDHTLGSCLDQTLEADCLALADQPEWFQEMTCADVEGQGLCWEHEGACCDHRTGTCLGNMTESACNSLTNQPGFFKDTACQEVEDEGLCDVHTGACCYESPRSWVCRILSKPECDLQPNSTFLGHDSECPSGGQAIHTGVAVTHYTSAPQACVGDGGRGLACTPGDPIDPWGTDSAETMCHQFDVVPESPPIPADFFGPGSDPFTDQVCLEGARLGDVVLPGYPDPFDFGEADTLVRRSADPFDRCELPSGTEVTVDTELVALSLKSVDPITITYNGGQDPQQWDVTVGLSEVAPPPGWIRAVKTHCNGGTYQSELHVQPKFVFTKTGDPSDVRVLDTGLAGIPYVVLSQPDPGDPTASDPPWTTDLPDDEAWGSPICTDFHPSIEDPAPTSECDCQPNGVHDACDIDEGGSTDVNENGIPDECEASIVSSDPANGAIDARQTAEIADGCAVPAGWNAIDLIFSSDAGGVGASDLAITVDPADVTPPGIDNIIHGGATLTVELDEIIPAGHWTILTHTPTASSTRIGYLPADVTGDGTSSPLDILRVIDCLNGVATCGLWQCDANRSNECNSADILRVIDLLNGAGCFDEWNGVSLP